MAQQYGVDVIFNTVGANKLKQATNELDKTRKVAMDANGRLQFVDQGFKKTGASAKSASVGVRGLGAAIQSALAPLLAVTTAVTALNKAVSTAFARDVAENRLKMLAETTGDYEYAIAAAREASEKFGFTLTEATQLFGDAQARIGTLGYNVEQVNEIFTGFNVVARQAGVSSEDAAGAFTQLAQGMAAGTLQGDELRSILERMPAVTKLLADEMGEPVEMIKKLGSEGKITSDIIYRALSNAAEGAGDLDGKLTPLQQSFNKLKQVTEDALNAFGEYIQPVLIPAIDLASAAVQKFSEVWQYILTRILPDLITAFQPVIDRVRELLEGFDWQSFGALLINALVKPLELAAIGLKNIVPLFTFVLDTVKALANTPVVQGLLSAVSGLLQAMGLLKNPVDEMNKSLEDSVKTTDQLKDKISAAKENTQAAAEAAANFAEAQKSVADEALRSAEMSQVILGNNIKLLQAELSLQNTLLGIEREKAQRALEEAKTFQQVEQAAQKVYEVAIKQAKLDKTIALQKIDAAVAELKVKQTLVKATLQQARAERAVLAAKGESTAKADKAIAAVVEQVRQTDALVANQVKIAELQKQQAEAIYGQTVEMAKLAKERNIAEGKERVLKSINEAKTAELQKQSGVISRQNSQLQKQVALQRQSLKIGQQSKQVVTGISRSSLPAEINKKIIDSGTNFLGVRASTREANRLREESRKAAEGMAIFEKQLSETDRTFKEIMASVESTVAGSTKWIASYAKEVYNKSRSSFDTASSSSTAASKSNSIFTGVTPTSGITGTRSFASGVYVDHPTRAMVGEGGEGEYIIPESKMHEAMARFGRGQRRGAVVGSGASANVNVNWSGEMIQMDGKAYVERSQMPGLIQTAVNETMNALHRNPRARAYAGIQ